MITHFLAVMFQQLLQGVFVAIDFALPQILLDSLASVGPVFNSFFQYTPAPVAAIAALFAIHYGSSLGFSVVEFALQSYRLIPFKAA
jgi:hypothetical protein